MCVSVCVDKKNRWYGDNDDDDDDDDDDDELTAETDAAASSSRGLVFVFDSDGCFRVFTTTATTIHPTKEFAIEQQRRR